MGRPAMNEANLDIRSQPGPHVFVTDLEFPDLAEDDRRHLARSLRLRNGDALTVSNAQGEWRTAVFGDSIVPSGPPRRVVSRPYVVGLGIALTKAAKPELAVQKATECGIDEITVFPATHSVARWDETKRERNEERLRKVAREAAMQSRRVTIPIVRVVATFGEVFPGESLVRADFGGVAVHGDHKFVLIGPEGGWSDEERELVPASVDLGPTVLRAETAAVVAAASLASFRARAAPVTD